MPTYRVIKLHFECPLHLGSGLAGEYGRSGEVVHSDTLKAGLFTAMLRLHGDADRALKVCQAYRISSAFPFQDLGQDSLWFFPKPMDRIPVQIAEVDELSLGKSLKKVRYFERSAFEKIANGKTLELDIDLVAKGGGYVGMPLEAFQNGQFFATPYQSTEQQRVSVPHEATGLEPMPYVFNRLYFRKGAGMFILYTGEEFESDWIAAWRLLGDMGIGGDRTVGNGMFRISQAELALDIDEEGARQVLLSLWCPEQEEVDESFLRKSSYGLVKRGGFITTSTGLNDLRWRKKSIYMFDVGSVFPRKRINGKVVDLKPDQVPIDHPVWRDGSAFTIPWHSVNQ